MKKYTEEEIVKNMEKCPYFQSCSQNFCPLDYDLHLRSGTKQDKCRFSMEVSRRIIGGQEIIFGGRQMPDTTLIFLPRSNFNNLNKTSQIRFNQLNKKYANKHNRNQCQN